MMLPNMSSLSIGEQYERFRYALDDSKIDPQIKKMADWQEEATCAICLGLLMEEDGQQGEPETTVEAIIEKPDPKTNKLVCNHVFHTRCLRMWIKTRRDCPTCRTPIPDSTIARLSPSLANQSQAQSDKEFAIARVSLNWMTLGNMPYSLRNDREVVLTAVRQNGQALRYASAELKNDREVVLAAVRQDGYALVYASAALKNDREVVLAAVRQDGQALVDASAEMKTDREVVLTAVREAGYALE